ncbi:MAG: serine/threonine-protein kinase [Phycisphaerales bacterium]|nr:serine/threonine-protein kinase [Phycisphaerales bacterium]
MSTHDALSKAFEQAAALSGPAREDFLHALKAKQPDIANEVASLLMFHASDPDRSADGRDRAAAGSGTGSSLLDRPAAALLGTTSSGGHAAFEDEPSLPPGTLLSADGLGEPGDGSTWSFKIIDELGRGGMGVVYEAEQAFPSRRVALKLMRGGIARGATTVPSNGHGAAGGGSAARRLMLEAEALGALHHPGIAHVYAAGTLRLVLDPTRQADAPPPAVSRWLFISMELVEGPTLGVWAKDRSLRAKVAIVAEICGAVEHAHQRGVVHRDLKPGNVLIEMGGGGQTSTGRVAQHAPPVVGQPKVLDFGVASLSNRTRRPDATLNIARGQLIGTLRYMSPEQARSGGGPGAAATPIADSRSDVYALGAILYELVTGTPPIPVDNASIIGAVERIVSQTPARPQGLANVLGRRTAADLETVLFKALAKEPGERYQHASDLGADLRRVLMDEPISARPPTLGEQLFRLVRRNRVAAAGVLAGMALLLVGASVAMWQAVRATRALDVARDETALSASALKFMQRMVSAGTPAETRGQDVTVREMLRSAARDIKNAPEDRATAAACRMLAEALRESGSPAEGEPLARRALAIERRLSGEESRTAIDAAVEVAHLASMLGKEAEARNEARRLYALCQRVYGPDDQLTLRSAMTLQFTLGENGPAEREEGERLVRDVVARLSRQVPPNDRRLLVVKNDLTALLLNQGRGADALPLAQEVHDLRVESLGVDHPDTIVSMSNLTAALSLNGRRDDALAVNTRAVGVAQSVLGPDHPSTLFVKFNRAQLLAQTGKLEEAEAEAKAVWEGRIKRLGPDTRLTLTSQGLYAALLLEQKRLDEAEPLITSLVQRSERSLGSADEDTHQTIALLWDLADARKDKAGMDAAAARLKGTRYDPAKLQQPPELPQPK